MQQEDTIERNEVANIMQIIFDSLFSILFSTSFDQTGNQKNHDIKTQLQLIINIFNETFASSSSDIFILDGNNVSINSNVEYINLATYSNTSILLTSVLQKRIAICNDPTNPYRDFYLDCGNISAPIAIIIAAPLWISNESSGYLLFRFFDNYNPEQCIELVEDLTTSLGPMLHYWAQQNLLINLQDLSSSSSSLTITSSEDIKLPSFDHKSFHLLVKNGLNCLCNLTFLHSVSSFLQCSWVIFIEARKNNTDGNYTFTLYNDHGQKTELSLLQEAKNEFAGFLYSIFGIDDASLVTFENSALSRRDGLIHLLNGLESQSSGLQSFLRYTLKNVVNLVGFRLIHPDIDLKIDPNPDNVYIAVVGGRSWGVFDSEEVCPRVASLSSVFEFAAEHRSMSRLFDYSNQLDLQVSSIESDVYTKRQYDLYMTEFRKCIQLRDIMAPVSYRQGIYESIIELGRKMKISLNLVLFEDLHHSFWRLQQTGEWSGEQIKEFPSVSSLEEVISSNKAGNYIEIKGMDCGYIIVCIDTGFQMTTVLLLLIKPILTSTGTEISSSAALSFEAKNALTSSAVAALSSEAAKSTLISYANVSLELSTEKLLFHLTDLQSVAENVATKADQTATPLAYAATVTPIIGASLVHPLLKCSAPACLSLPMYISSGRLVDLLHPTSTTLPIPLAHAIRSTFLLAQSSNFEGGYFHLLGSANIYTEYLYEVKAVAKDSLVDFDRALLYAHKGIKDLLRDGEDSIVIIVLCNARCVFPPAAFRLLDSLYFRHLLPIQLLNQVHSAFIGGTSYQDLVSSRASTAEFLKQLSVIFGVNNKSVGTGGGVPLQQHFHELISSIGFHSELLNVLFDELTRQGFVDILSSALEQAASTTLDHSFSPALLATAQEKQVEEPYSRRAAIEDQRGRVGANDRLPHYAHRYFDVVATLRTQLDKQDILERQTMVEQDREGIEEDLLATQRTVEVESSLLGIITDCVFDIYDQSSAVGEGECSRSEGCLQSVHFHLNRMPGVSKVEIQFKSRSGDVFNNSTQAMTAEEARDVMTPTTRNFRSTPILGSPEPVVKINTKDFEFECHDIKGTIRLTFDTPPSSTKEIGDGLEDVVVRTLCKILGRRLYELDKAQKNREALKLRAQELSKRQREISSVDSERASLQTNLEAATLEIKRLQEAMQALQQAYEADKILFQEAEVYSQLVIDASKIELIEQQKMFEVDLETCREKIAKVKSELTDIEGQKEEACKHILTLEEMLQLHEQDYIRKETDWKRLSEEAQSALSTANELKQRELLSQIEQINQEKSKLAAENEKLVLNLHEMEKKKLNSKVEETLLRDIEELKVDKAKAIHKLVKRDAKLKDAAVTIENLQKSYDSIKAESSLLIMRLQVENQELSAQVSDLRRENKFTLQERVTVEVQEGDYSSSGNVVQALKSSLAKSEVESANFRRKYEETISITLPRLQQKLETALHTNDVLQQTVDETAYLLREKDREIDIWRKKFAIQEKERDTLIEGWKDILASAGGRTSSPGVAKSLKKSPR